MSKPRKHGKKWRIRWYNENGKRQSEVYENCRDAEYALKRHQTEVEDIRRGFLLRPSRDRSFNELDKRWMATRGALKRNPNDDLSILRAHLRPAFGELTLRQITSERIADFSAKLSATRAPLTVRNILTLLGAMLRQAVEWGWIESLPRIRKPKVRLFNKDYRYLRTDEEVDKFLNAAEEEALPTVAPMYATAVFTGMRAGELAGLRWQDVDFNRRLITVQRSYKGPTKAGDIRHVPIVDRLLPILKAWRLACGNRLVFPNSAGEMWDQRGRVFAEVLKRVLVRAGFDARYVHFHGLRHTFASHWVMKGGDIFRLQKILGHKSSQVTQRYAHLAPAAYEGDWGRFGQHEEKDEKVIQLKNAEG